MQSDAGPATRAPAPLMRGVSRLGHRRMSRIIIAFVFSLFPLSAQSTEDRIARFYKPVHCNTTYCKPSIKAFNFQTYYSSPEAELDAVTRKIGDQQNIASEAGIMISKIEYYRGVAFVDISISDMKNLGRRKYSDESVLGATVHAIVCTAKGLALEGLSIFIERLGGQDLSLGREHERVYSKLDLDGTACP